MNNQNAKADNGKPKLSLVPTEIINCIARCREYGTKKYKSPDNWKDVEKERYIDAAYRHWIKYVNDNNSVDEESGLPHLYHCCCNLAFLCEFDKVEREVKKIKNGIFESALLPYKPTNCSEKCNLEDCKYYDKGTKSCVLFPNEHKECECKKQQVEQNKDKIYFNTSCNDFFSPMCEDNVKGHLDGHDFDCTFYYQKEDNKCVNECRIDDVMFGKIFSHRCKTCPFYKNKKCKIKQKLKHHLELRGIDRKGCE